MHYRAGEVLGLPGNPEGGHATHLVGWDQARGVFIGENSWGTGWGDDGYYLIAPEVIANPISPSFPCCVRETDFAAATGARNPRIFIHRPDFAAGTKKCRPLRTA